MQTNNFEANTIVFTLKKDTATFDLSLPKKTEVVSVKLIQPNGKEQDITKIIKPLLLKRERK